MSTKMVSELTITELQDILKEMDEHDKNTKTKKFCIAISTRNKPCKNFAWGDCDEQLCYSHRKLVGTEPVTEEVVPPKPIKKTYCVAITKKNEKCKKYVWGKCEEYCYSHRNLVGSTEPEDKEELAAIEDAIESFTPKEYDTFELVF